MKTTKTKSKQWSKVTSEKGHRWWCYVLTARFSLSPLLKRTCGFSIIRVIPTIKLEWIVISNKVTKSNNFSSRNKRINYSVLAQAQMIQKVQLFDYYNLPQGYNGLQMPVPTRTVCCKTCHSAFPFRHMLFFTQFQTYVSIGVFSWEVKNFYVSHQMFYGIS
jgi:hypothetical protein